MDNREIIAGNKLIAEFMGFVEDDKIYTNASKSNPLPPFWHQGYSNKCCEDDIRFHSSWDWLMAVCIKLGMEFVSTNIVLTYKNVIDEIRNLEINKEL